MILYLDTESLVKFYVEEESSSKVNGTSVVAYPKARASFALRFRENAFTPGEYKRLSSSLDKDWDNYLIVHVTRELVGQAGDLTEKHGLRGFDAIHLSSALPLSHFLSKVCKCLPESRN